MVRKPALLWTPLEHARLDAEELTIDADLPAEEVDAIDGETKALTLTHPGAGGEDDECPVAGSDRLSECIDLRWPQWNDLAPLSRGGNLMPMHGEAGMSRSATAALKMVETHR